MTELDFLKQAQQRNGIVCIYYPPKQRRRRPILHTRQVVLIADYEIASGRWTDGGSVPWFMHSVAHPLGYLFPAFLLHDTSLFDGYGWTASNERFDKAMRALNAPTWQRWVVLGAVKANGQWQYIRARLGWSADYVGNTEDEHAQTGRGRPRAGR